MRTFTKRGLEWFAATLLTLVVAEVATAGYGVEDFERVPNGSPVTALGVQWGADSGGVIVSNLASLAGTNVLYLPAYAMVSNAVDKTPVDPVWTEFTLNDAGRLEVDGGPVADTNLVVMAGVSKGGHVMLYDTNGWVAVTNDVWGTNVTLAAGNWARLSIFKNYANRTAAVFLDGHLMRQQLPFINTNVSAYALFRLDSGKDGPALLDNTFISNAIPASLSTVDLDDDGVADASELQQVGNVDTIGRLQIVVSASNMTFGTAGGGSVTPAGPLLVKHGTTNFVCVGAVGYALDRVWTNGFVATNFSGLNLGSGTFVWPGIESDGTAMVGFVQKPVVTVPGDFSTLSNALATMVEGTVIQVSGAAAESLAITKSVSLVGNNAGLSGTTLSVSNGVTVSVSGFTNVAISGTVTLGTNSLMVITNSTVVFSALTFQTGAVLRVSNGTATVNGVTLSGRFDLDAGWGGAVKAQSLNWSDDFEVYGAGTPLGILGSFGWGVSAPGATVQTRGTKAAFLPECLTASNAVSAGGASNVWVELRLQESSHIDPLGLPSPHGNEAAMVGFDTNGWLMAYNPVAAAWETYSNDVSGATMPKVGTGEWGQISLFEDFGTHRVAVFMNGHLVRQQLRFISMSLGSCQGMSVESGNTPATYLDSVKIWTNVPVGVTNDPAVSDLDRDGILDALEIQQSGDLTANPRGTIFKIR